MIELHLFLDLPDLATLCASLVAVVSSGGLAALMLREYREWRRNQERQAAYLRERQQPFPDPFESRPTRS